MKKKRAQLLAVHGRRGDRVRVFVTPDRELGAFTLTVQNSTPTTLKVIPSATAARVELILGPNGNWMESGYQTL